MLGSFGSSLSDMPAGGARYLTAVESEFTLFKLESALVERLSISGVP